MTQDPPEKRAVLLLLGDEKVRYYPILAKYFGGANSALLLSQLLYWHGKQHDPDGWIYKTVAELQIETGLTEREQESARVKLKHAGVIDYKRKGMPARPHYQLIWDTFIATLGGDPPVRTKRPNMIEQSAPSCEDAGSGDVLGQNVLTNSVTTTEITSATTSLGADTADRAAAPVVDAPVDAPKEPEPKPRKAKVKAEPDPRSFHPAIQLVRELCGRYPDKAIYNRLIECLGDSPNRVTAEACWVTWRERGGSPMNFTPFTEWYPKGGAPAYQANGYRNGNNNGSGKGNAAEIKSEYTPAEEADALRRAEESIASMAARRAKREAAQAQGAK